jgi:hypothetical protein
MVGPSAILDRKWKEREHALHRRKVSQAKSNIKKFQVLAYGP